MRGVTTDVVVAAVTDGVEVEAVIGGVEVATGVTAVDVADSPPRSDPGIPTVDVTAIVGAPVSVSEFSIISNVVR